MTALKTEAAVHEQYLAEAHAELDAMLGEVGELDATPEPERAPSRSLLQVVVIALIAVAVFALGVLVLRGLRPRRMAVHLR